MQGVQERQNIEHGCHPAYELLISSAGQAHIKEKGVKEIRCYYTTRKQPSRLLAPEEEPSNTKQLPNSKSNNSFILNC
jgi:hypothetical protein